MSGILISADLFHLGFEPVRLDGADGKVLYDELSFSEADQKRLDMLVSQYSAK